MADLAALDRSCRVPREAINARRLRDSRAIRMSLAPLAYLAPAMALYAVFFVFPLAFALVLSFCEWNLVSPRAAFVGFENYRALIADKVFWISLSNTGLYAAATVFPSMAIALGLALLVEHSGKAKGLFRTLLYLPVVASFAVTALIWMLMMSPTQGLFKIVLSSLGLPSPNWLNDPAWALPALALVGIWKSAGYSMVLYIVGLHGIDKQVLEAARVDGAGFFRRLTSVTMPLLAPVHLFVMVVSLINSFQVFTAVHIMSKGGPNNATNVLVYHIWEEAFQFFDIGRSSALSFITFLLVLGLAIIQIRLTEKGDIYGRH